MRKNPEVVAVPSTDPRYGELLGSAAAGRLTILGDRYTEDGERVTAFASKTRRNPSITIGQEFFSAALRDYRDWREKWWREAIQNSVDAGATRIDCEVKELPDESYRVSVHDNGGGMDEDTLLTKFLVLGATAKRAAPGSVGGFGKAKELLLLPWISWEVASGSTVVSGNGINYEITKGKATRGTRITVVMPADQHTTESAAISFIKKCYLPGRSFKVNGQSVRASLKVGEFIEDLAGKAELYYSKRTRLAAPVLLVRVKGLFMFERWLPEGVKGTVIIEITAPSVKVLTANRDGIRDWQLQEAVDKFVNRLAADVRSALKGQRNKIRKKWKGTGKFVAARERDLEDYLLGSVQDYGSSGVNLFSDDQVRQMQEILEKKGGSEQPEREVPDDAPDADEPTPGAPPLNFRIPPSLVRVAGAVSLKGPAHVEAIAKQLAWEPDFFIINEMDNWRVPKKFFPETMSANIRKLVRFWAELCRFVLIQLGSSERFGVGFVFDDDTQGLYTHDEGEDWLLLNPYRNGEVIDKKEYQRYDRRKAGPLYRLSDRDDVSMLYALAVHEATHIADGISYHNEAFAVAFTTNVAKTSGKRREINRILREIRSL